MSVLDSPKFKTIIDNVATLITRITATRASNLDNITATVMARLDANISSIVGGKVRKSMTFNSSGTWTMPAGVSSVELFLVAGGGGSDAPFSTTYIARPGSGGQVIKKRITVTGDLTITIGGGGTGNNNGTDSTITGGATVTAKGGAYGSDAFVGTSFPEGASGGGAGAGGHGEDPIMKTEAGEVNYEFKQGQSNAYSGCATGRLLESDGECLAGNGGVGIDEFGGGGGGAEKGQSATDGGLGCMGGDDVEESGAANTGGGAGAADAIDLTGGSGYCRIDWEE